MKKTLLKRTIILITLLTIICCFGILYYTVGSIPAYAMELTGDESDTVFWENLEELYQDNDSDYIAVKADKEIVYDLNLEQLGYIYDFEINGNSGYSIILKSNTDFVVTEMFFDSVNPFRNIADEKKIYVAFMTYLKYDNGEYKFADGQNALTDEYIDKLRKIAYYSAGDGFTTSSDTIYYSSRNEDKYNLASRHPGLTNVSGISNACAAIAGGNIIQFWDRYKTDLIADYTPGNALGNSYIYKGESTTTASVIKQLYSDMEVNSTGPGATISQFKSGMTKYSNRQGYAITFNSCMSGGSFNYNTAKQNIVSGQPIALFLDTYNVGLIDENTDYDAVAYLLGKGTHVMAGFGYKEVIYTLNSGATRQDKYIAVASGIGQCPKGFFNVNYNTMIDDAYGIMIA